MKMEQSTSEKSKTISVCEFVRNEREKFASEYGGRPIAEFDVLTDKLDGRYPSVYVVRQPRSTYTGWVYEFSEQNEWCHSRMNQVDFFRIGRKFYFTRNDDAIMFKLSFT